MPPSSGIKQKIKARVYDLGFSLCGITTPQVMSNYANYLNWLQAGNHADMAYLANEFHVGKRKDPRMLMPSVQSILVLGLRYPLHSLEHLINPDLGLVGGYATGEDYHKRIPGMLAPLLESLPELFTAPVTAQAYTDSAPILERDLGISAGLGWIGKNSCLISPAEGSAFLLAEVFLDQVLEPDLPFLEDRCGSCQRCIQACPTNCILPDRTLDSRRCISYHTIENRGEIPAEIAEKLGNWIFGCDICQMVCPWNQKRNHEPTDTLEPIAFSRAEMESILRMDEKTFMSAFANSAISRAKLTGLKRNILFRLKNASKQE